MSQLSIRNPFPPICKDGTEEVNFYKRIKAIPYRGDHLNSSHNYLKVLYDLYELSSSFGAVINELIYCGFEGDIDLMKSQKVGLKLSEDEMNESMLDRTEKVQFCDTIEKFGFDLSDIISNVKKEVRHYKVSGNTYLRVRIVNVNGATKINEFVVDPRSAMISGEGKALIISEKFCSYIKGWSKSVKKDDFEVVPIYPEVRRTKNVTETVFHLKNEDGQSDIYGMPESIQSVYWQFIEYALSSLSAKVSAHEFVTKKIMQLPSIDPALLKSGNELVSRMLDDFKNTIKNLMLNSGENASSIAVLNMPLASHGEIKLHDIEINRDTDWFKCQIETARSKIYELNRTYGQLTGAKDAKSSLGQDAIIALDARYYSKTVKPYQSMMANHRMKVLNFISEETNTPSIKDIKMIFPNRSKEIRDELEASKTTTNENRSQVLGGS